MRIRRSAFVCVLFALWAGSPATNGAETAKTALDFDLSNGHRFVRLADLPPQVTVVNFWRYDCPPCLREMPVLATLARSGTARILTVALHRQAEDMLAPSAVRQALASVETLYGPSEPRGLLARFGNPVGALPHTVVLDPARRRCAIRSGEIDAQWLAAAITRCQTQGESQ